MLVSVIVPYFNDELNINKCINSITNQTYKKFEVIIVDDENTQKSFNTLKKLKKKNKVRVISTLRNSGVAFARNKGIKSSKGKLIAFLDSDDYWKKNKLKEQVSAFKQNNIDVCYTNYYGITNKSKIIYKVKSPQQMDYKKFIASCPIACSSVMLKKSLTKKNKFKNLKTKEDYLLWLELSKKKYKFFGINKFLTFYRLRKNSLSRLHTTKFICAFKIYYFYLKFNFFYSLIMVYRLYMNSFLKKYL